MTPIPPTSGGARGGLTAAVNDQDSKFGTFGISKEPSGSVVASTAVPGPGTPAERRTRTPPRARSVPYSRRIPSTEPVPRSFQAATTREGALGAASAPRPAGPPPPAGRAAPPP